MNMLEQVNFLLEGEYDTGMTSVKDGLPYRRMAFQDVYWRFQSDRLTATDCIAIIYFSIYQIGDPDEASVVDAWSAEIRDAAKAGEITARNPATLLPFKALPDGWDWLISIDDCDKLLKARGLDWQINTVVEHIADELFHMSGNEAAAPSETPEKAAPPETATAPAVRGITKQQVMNAFDGMAFDSKHWSKNLASPQKWLLDCRVALGNKNISALWNPALIAAALYDKNISLKQLDAVFVGLKDWADEWRDVSANFRD